MRNRANDLAILQNRAAAHSLHHTAGLRKKLLVRHAQQQISRAAGRRIDFSISISYSRVSLPETVAKIAALPVLISSFFAIGSAAPVIFAASSAESLPKMPHSVLA